MNMNINVKCRSIEEAEYKSGEIKYTAVFDNEVPFVELILGGLLNKTFEVGKLYNINFKEV